MDGWISGNYTIQVSYQPFLKRKELLYRGDIHSHKTPKEGYKSKGSPRGGQMRRCGQLHVSQVRPAPSIPVLGRQPNSASGSHIRCSLMAVGDRGGQEETCPMLLLREA